MPFLIAWWLACCWTFSAAWPRPFDDWKNGLFYIGAAVLCISRLWRGRMAMGVPRALGWCAAGYAGAVAVSFVNPAFPWYEGLLAAARLLLWAGCVWGLAQWPVDTHLRLCRWTTASAALIALCTLANRLGIMFWPYGDIWLAPVGHVTYYGDFMALHIPFAVYCIGTEQRWWKRAGWIGAALALAYGLWACGTRSSVFGLAAGGLLALVCWWRHARIFPWRACLMACGTAAALLFLFQSVQPTSGRGYSLVRRFTPLFALRSVEDLRATFVGRWSGYATTARMIEARPLTGHGIGSYRFVYPEYAARDLDTPLVSAARWYMHPHNELLHQASEVGLIGLAAFLGLWGVLFVGGLRALRRAETTAQAQWTIMALAGCTIAFISWQLSTNFLFPLSRLLVALYAAMVWGTIRIASPPSADRNDNPCLLPLAGTTIIAIATLLLTAYHASLYATQRTWRTADPALRLVWARRAYRLAPGAFDPTYAYASTLQQRGRWTDAVPVIERLHANYPYVPAALFLTAQSRLQMGRLDEARQLLQHALQNDPHFVGARQLLDRLEKSP